MILYVLSIVTISTDIYNMENEVFIKTSEEAAREKLKQIIAEAELDIEVTDTTTYVDHYIDGVGSFYATITETRIEEEK